MINPFLRGSAPGRARGASQRPGSFQVGHKKLGGRKHGTPNKRTREYREALFEVANQIGSDGKGKEGLRGYLTVIAMYRPAVFVRMLGALMRPGGASEPDEPEPDEPEPEKRLTIEEAKAELRKAGFSEEKVKAILEDAERLGKKDDLERSQDTKASPEA